MRFLIDRCAGRRLASWLGEMGHDVRHVADLGPDPGDLSLLKLASSDGRILISIDSDFGTLVYRDAEPHRGLVRLPDVPAEKRIQIMQDLLARHSGDMIAGAVITVRGNRIRITSPSQNFRQ